jgi:rhodanese-related sulfurtransferase
VPKSEVTVNELAALQDVLVVDVREVDEYVEGHVPGAINLPLSSFVDTFTQIPTSHTVYVVCAAGGRSARACEFLSQTSEFGNSHLVNVLGGTNAWIIEGNKVVTGDKPN